jgi:hypothetical protein
MYTKSQWLVIIFSGWILTVLVLLSLLNSLDYVYFFILCLIGFLIIVEVAGPFTTKPRWKSRINILVIIGLIAFAAIVVTRVWDIIGQKYL